MGKNQNGKLKKTAFFKIANSQKLFMKFMQLFISRGLLICTWISENLGLEKFRSTRKLSFAQFVLTYTF